MNKLNNNVVLYLTSYNFLGMNEIIESEFFSVVQGWVNIVTDNSTKFVSLQLFRSGKTSKYILFEIWMENSREERYDYTVILNNSIKQFIDTPIKIIPWNIAELISLNPPLCTQGIAYFPFNTLECSLLSLKGINNLDYIPAESIWNRGLRKFTKAAQSKQIWINGENPYEIFISIIWRTYVSWKGFPLEHISMLDSKTRDSISPASYIYDPYTCFLIQNRQSSDYY